MLPFHFHMETPEEGGEAGEGEAGAEPEEEVKCEASSKASAAIDAPLQLCIGPAAPATAGSRSHAVKEEPASTTTSASDTATASAWGSAAANDAPPTVVPATGLALQLASSVVRQDGRFSLSTRRDAEGMSGAAGGVSELTDSTPSPGAGPTGLHSGEAVPERQPLSLFPQVGAD